MGIRTWLTLGVLALLAAALAHPAEAQGRGRRGGFGRGGRGWGSDFREQMRQWQEQQRTEEARRKLESQISDGFAALRSLDTPAAVLAFHDALDIHPEEPRARLGLALASAQKGQYSKAQSELELAGRAKADPRLVAYNQAVLSTRLNLKGRAMVILGRLIAESKPPDAAMVRAQRTLVAGLDERERAAIAALPKLLAALEAAEAAIKSGADEGNAQDPSGPPPKVLPFLMPGDEAMPEKPVKPVAKPVPPVTASGGAPAPVVAEAPKPTEAPVKPPDVIDPPAPPITAKAAKRTISGAAFAVAPDLLLTSAALAAGAQRIEVEDSTGKTHEAKLIASDAESGLALLKVAGAKFAPMGLAESTRPGLVSVAAFTKPSIFGPNLEVLRGELVGSGATLALRAASHPRSAGSPIIDEQRRVVGLLAAGRDDDPGRLPVVAVEAIRKFAQGNFAPAAATAAADPAECVAEVTVTRVD